METKRIIILVSSLDLGGAERQAFNLAVFLKRKGEKVKIIGLNPPGKLAELCSINEIAWAVIPFSSPRTIFDWLPELVKFWRQLRREKADIIISYTLIPNVIGGIIWRFIPVKKFFWNQRDEGIEDGNHYVKWLAVRLTSDFLANSEGGKGYLTKSLGVSASKVMVIKNAVKLDLPQLTKTVWRKKLKIPAKAFLACQIANLSAKRDYLTLLKAWKIVAQKKNRYLALAGRTDCGKIRIEDLLSDLGIANRVRVLGHVDDVSGLLRASDLYVYSSVSEGSPNSVIEAAMSDLAVVATDIPAIRESIARQNWPYLAAPYDSLKMANKINLLWRNYRLRLKLGRANNVWVQKNFAHDRNISFLVNKLLN